MNRKSTDSIRGIVFNENVDARGEAAWNFAAHQGDEISVFSQYELDWEVSSIPEERPWNRSFEEAFAKFSQAWGGPYLQFRPPDLSTFLSLVSDTFFRHRHAIVLPHGLDFASRRAVLQQVEDFKVRQGHDNDLKHPGRWARSIFRFTPWVFLYGFIEESPEAIFVSGGDAEGVGELVQILSTDPRNCIIDRF